MSPPPAKLNDVGGGGLGVVSAGAFGTTLRPSVARSTPAVSVTVRIRPNFPNIASPPASGQAARGSAKFT